MCGLYHSAAACYDASPVPMPMDLRVEPRHCMFHTEVVYAVLRGGRVSAWGCARFSNTLTLLLRGAGGVNPFHGVVKLPICVSSQPTNVCSGRTKLLRESRSRGIVITVAEKS